jgi:hypothetical protein
MQDREVFDPTVSFGTAEPQEFRSCMYVGEDSSFPRELKMTGN